LARLVPPDVIARIASALFEATGAPPDQARLVAEELTASSLMGHDSHGVIRIPEYVDLAARGTIIPGAAVGVERTGGGSAIVDCGRNYGAVGAHVAVTTAIELAREHKVACVVTRRCNHIGRVGAYVQRAAEGDLIAIATCNSPIHGHFVLPWGGTRGRLGTNPIAYAVPTHGEPILADLSTCVAPEGKIRVYKNREQPLPEGWIVDALGEPSTDPAAFYGPPPGAILPLGGPAGHKGYALGLLVELLGSPLAGVATTDPTVLGNGLCLLVVDPRAFGPIEAFKDLVEATVAYIKSSKPDDVGAGEVLVPGELEFRTRRRRLVEGIPVDDPTWDAIQQGARKLQVDLDALLAR
jgi:uncharacterized oxidoreductase